MALGNLIILSFLRLVGLLILCSCTLIFYKFTLRRINVLKHAVFAGGFLLTLHIMITVLKKEGEEGDRQEKAIVGYLAAVLAVIFCAAPLANLGQVYIHTYILMQKYYLNPKS